MENKTRKTHELTKTKYKEEGTILKKEENYSTVFEDDIDDNDDTFDTFVDYEEKYEYGAMSKRPKPQIPAKNTYSFNRPL